MKIEYPTYEEAKRIVQEKGIQSAKEYNLYCRELGLPAIPSYSYKGKGWIDWYDYLGKKSVKYPTYKEAKRIVQESGIKSKREYNSLQKKLGLPAEPDSFYKDKGWIDWYSFLGKRNIRSYPPYEEARGMVQEKGIKTKDEYESLQIELGLPVQPDVYYKKKGWTDWYDFLGKKSVKYPTYEEAKRIVQENRTQSAREYHSVCKNLGLPVKPESYYKNEGWTDWYDFLGKSERTSQNERKYNFFKRLAINPVLLKDAPLKVLYIFFSKFREITEDITSLLGTSSYEERLNWVKEQLNSLKDVSLSKDKSSGEELDELSAMESVLEENDDVKKSLSEGDAERFNTILENYVHSVINRELIAENGD